MGPVGTGLLLGGTSIFGGLTGSAALKTEANQLEYQSKQYKLRGSQIAHTRREAYGEALSAIRVNRASRNLKPDSYSALKSQDVSRKREHTNENSQVLGEKLKEQQLLSSAAAKRRAAPFAILTGVTQGIAQISNGFNEAAKGGVTGGP